MTSADQGSEQTAVNKEHADVLRGLVTETMPCAITAIQAAIALLDPEPVVGETRDPHPIGGNAAVPVLGPKPAGDATERERCVHFALEITQIKQHHGMAEIADVIQRARAELLAENERLRAARQQDLSGTGSHRGVSARAGG